MAGNVGDIPLDTEEEIVQRASKLESCLLGVTVKELSKSAISVDGRNHISRWFSWKSKIAHKKLSAELWEDIRALVLDSWKQSHLLEVSGFMKEWITKFLMCSLLLKIALITLQFFKWVKVMGLYQWRIKRDMENKCTISIQQLCSFSNVEGDVKTTGVSCASNEIHVPVMQVHE